MASKIQAFPWDRHLALTDILVIFSPSLVLYVPSTALNHTLLYYEVFYGLSLPSFMIENGIEMVRFSANDPFTEISL